MWPSSRVLLGGLPGFVRTRQRSAESHDGKGKQAYALEPRPHCLTNQRRNTPTSDATAWFVLLWLPDGIRQCGCILPPICCVRVLFEGVTVPPATVPVVVELIFCARPSRLIRAFSLLGDISFLGLNSPFERV